MKIYLTTISTYMKRISLEWFNADQQRLSREASVCHKAKACDL